VKIRDKAIIELYSVVVFSFLELIQAKSVTKNQKRKEAKEKNIYI